ncbi:hypothetical protein FQZ97_971770 [compost metagenome]
MPCPTSTRRSLRSTISRVGPRVGSGRVLMSSVDLMKCTAKRSWRFRSAFPSPTFCSAASPLRPRSPPCSTANGARRWRSSQPHPMLPAILACVSISAPPTDPAEWCWKRRGSSKPCSTRRGGCRARTTPSASSAIMTAATVAWFAGFWPRIGSRHARRHC